MTDTLDRLTDDGAVLRARVRYARYPQKMTLARPPRRDRVTADHARLRQAVPV